MVAAIHLPPRDPRLGDGFWPLRNPNSTSSVSLNRQERTGKCQWSRREFIVTGRLFHWAKPSGQGVGHGRGTWHVGWKNAPITDCIWFSMQKHWPNSVTSCSRAKYWIRRRNGISDLSRNLEDLSNMPTEFLESSLMCCARLLSMWNSTFKSNTPSKRMSNYWHAIGFWFGWHSNQITPTEQCPFIKDLATKWWLLTVSLLPPFTRNSRFPS
jgi:hypothetical protein